MAPSPRHSGGWRTVAICFLILSIAFGVRLSFGVFFDALTRDPAFGWSRADTAGVFSVTMIVFALSSTTIGWFLDRFGPRCVFAVGLCIMGSGLVLTGRMGSLRDFYLFYGVWTGLGIATLGLSMHAATISGWFSRADGRRGLAIGVAFSGTGLGVLLYAPLVERIIAWSDWRTAFFVLASVLFALVPLVLWGMRSAPPISVGLESSRTLAGDSRGARAVGWTWRSAVRTLPFWLLMLSGACSLFTLRMVTVHQVSHFVDNGVPRLTAATVLGSGGLITALAFIVFGQLSDRIGRARTFYIGSVAQIGALLLLMSIWRGVPMTLLYLYALLWGIGEGSRSGLLTTLASDLFTGPNVGAIVGTMGAFFGAGAALGSWLAGLLYDLSGSYVTAFAIALAATLVATASLFLVQRGRQAVPHAHLISSA